MSTLLAQISNPAVPAVDDLVRAGGNSGTIGASILSRYVAVSIQTAIVLGGLASLVFMFLAAINWITAGGDKGKIEKAQQRIVQSLLGLGVIFSIVAIAVFIGPLFGLDLLRLEFLNQIQNTTYGPLPGGNVPTVPTTFP